jgi:hypothetical protein
MSKVPTRPHHFCYWVHQLITTVLVRLVDNSDNDTKMKLAETYEVLGETRRAYDLVNESMFIPFSLFLG